MIELRQNLLNSSQDIWKIIFMALYKVALRSVNMAKHQNGRLTLRKNLSCRISPKLLCKGFKGKEKCKVILMLN
jgi:hypothetical protein